MSADPIRAAEEGEVAVPRPGQDRRERELFLLRSLYRQVSAFLVAPYLPEHTESLAKAAKAVHDFKSGTTS